MKRKGLIILISILTLALIVTAVVLLTPSEKQQQLSFTGVKIDNKGQVLDECSITWNTTYKDGPLSDPTYYEVSAAIEDHYDLPYSLSTGDPLTVTSLSDWDFDQIQGSVYFAEINRYCPVQYIIAHDQSWCIVIVSDPSEGAAYFIGTADPSLDPTTIYRDYYYYFFQE